MQQMSCPSLVGRADESATLLAALDDACTARGSVVWVTGEAGIGKSRLVSEFCEQAAGRGLPVLVGRAVDTGTPVLFRPLFEALSGYFRRNGATDANSVQRRALAQLVPEWRVPGEEPYQASPMEIGEGLLRLLTSLADDTCVLVLEDLHWADSETAAVLEYVADNIAATQVLCVVTSRPGGDDHNDRVLQDIAARGSAIRVDLQRLTTEELAVMTAGCLGTELVDADVTLLIDDFADGLPFLVEEILATSVADGTIAAAANAEGWRVVSGRGPAVPERMAGLVRRKMSALDPGAARVLRVAAVLGQRFDVKLLSAALGASTSEVADAMRAGIDAQLLSPDHSGPVVEFRHALTREAIFEQLLPLERIETARQVLAALELDRPDLAESFGEQAAALAELAGDTERAAELLLSVARRAQRRGALAAAVPLLLRAWSYVDEAGQEWFEIGEVLLSVLASTGEVDEAFAVGDRLRTAVTAPDQVANIHLALARAAAGASRWNTASQHVKATREHAAYAPGSLMSARADAVSAEVAAGQGMFEDAAVLARAAQDIAEQHHDHELRAAAALVLGRCERGRGVANPAATFDSVIQIGREHGLPAWKLRALMERSSLALWNYEPPDGILAAREEAASAGALVVVAHLDNFLALQAHDRGNMDQVDPAARRCVELAGKLRLSTLQGVGTVSLAVSAAYRGEKDRLEVLLADADACSDSHPDVVALSCAARAWYWIYRDDLRRAASALSEAMVYLRATPAMACPERGMWALFEAIAGDGEAAVLELDRYVGPNHVMIDSYRHYARAVLRGREGAVDEAARHVALAERVQPTPWFQHHARRLVAESAHRDGWGEPVVWLRDGHDYCGRRGEEHLSSSCRSLLAKFGVALPRPRRRDQGVPAALSAHGVTAREAEVWELLGEARSTRAIAETLHISPKTVERHVANLATKLGLEGRATVVAHAARSAQTDAD